MSEFELQRLRKIARSKMARETSQLRTDYDGLISAAWIRIASGTSVPIVDMSHYMAISAIAMSRVLVDRARSRNAERRRVKLVPLDFEPACRSCSPAEILTVRRAFSELARECPSQAVVVRLRAVEGLSEHECAQLIRVSARTVRRRFASGTEKMRRLLGGSILERRAA